MKALTEILILGLLGIWGCSSPHRMDEEALHRLNTPPKVTKTLKTAPMKDNNQYLGNFREQNCWANTETLNCKLKHAHLLLDRFNQSLMSLDGAVGGCCNKY